MPCWQLSQSAQPVFEITYVMEKKAKLQIYTARLSTGADHEDVYNLEILA